MFLVGTSHDLLLSCVMIVSEGTDDGAAVQGMGITGPHQAPISATSCECTTLECGLFAMRSYSWHLMIVGFWRLDVWRLPRPAHSTAHLPQACCRREPNLGSLVSILISAVHAVFMYLLAYQLQTRSGICTHLASSQKMLPERLRLCLQ